jgi:hypothetical protein
VGGPGFIPRAGRKKEQTAEYSEYGSSQCPDEFVDAEGEEDEIIQALSDCQLG